MTTARSSASVIGRPGSRRPSRLSRACRRYRPSARRPRSPSPPPPRSAAPRSAISSEWSSIIAADRIVAARIGDTLPGDVGRRSVDRLVQPQARPPARQRGGGKHPDRSGAHARLVGQDVAEQIAGDDHVELAGIAHQLHRGVVDVHVGQFDIVVIARHFVDDVAPQLRGFEHIGLVDRAKLLLAPPRGLEPDAGDALDLDLVVAHQVPAFAHPAEPVRRPFSPK